MKDGGCFGIYKNLYYTFSKKEKWNKDLNLKK